MSTDTWNIDTAHSGINFSVRHMVVSKVRGKFAAWRGSLRFNESEPASARVDVVIDAASIETGVADRDQHLRSPDFLDAAQFPQITYRSRSAERLAADRYRVVGDLTIRGVTREVPLEVELGGMAKDPWGKQRVGFTAQARLDRKDFGLTWNQVLEAGGVLVGERIDVEIELEAVRATEAQVA